MASVTLLFSLCLVYIRLQALFHLVVCVLVLCVSVLCCCPFPALLWVSEVGTAQSWPCRPPPAQAASLHPWPSIQQPAHPPPTPQVSCCLPRATLAPPVTSLLYSCPAGIAAMARAFLFSKPRNQTLILWNGATAPCLFAAPHTGDLAGRGIICPE